MSEWFVPTQWADQVEHRRKLAEAINSLQNTWDYWTPTVTPQTGIFTTLGTVVGRYKQIGITLFGHIDIGITTNGTAAGFIDFTLPLPSSIFQIGSGREINVVGTMLSITCGGSIATILTYNNLYPGGSGYRLIGSFFYPVIL